MYIPVLICLIPPFYRSGHRFLGTGFLGLVDLCFCLSSIDPGPADILIVYTFHFLSMDLRLE